MSQNIKTLFASNYNPENWKDLLKTIFKDKATAFYKEPLDRKREDFKDHNVTESILEFGNIVLDDKTRILFYEVKLIESKQLSSKTSLRNIISKEITPGNEDGIIATFYNPKSKEWRLTFVSKSLYWDEEFNQIKNETQPKRYTFLLGQGESIKTALSQFDWLLHEIKNKEITIEHLLKTFSVQKITNEFFKKYFDHFKLLVAYISDNQAAFSFFKNQVDNNKTDAAQQEDAEKLVRQFVKKLMGRIVFLYFLQKKGWLGVPADEPWGNGEKDFISKLFTQFDNKNEFYEQCLVPLFFETLNKDRKNQNDIFQITNTKIPYLNGGLFDKDQIEPTQIKIIPDRFDTLFEFFDQYNFTIDENSPDDQDIGIDPEMLGLIFENLLEDNKDKGTFYTPKEVVHFMCKESISQYIQNHLANTATPHELKEIAIYIKDANPKINIEIIKKYAKQIDNALTDCKICDPAIGSGAFPMGMVFEMMRLKKELHAFYKHDDFIYLKEKLAIIKNNIYGVDLDKGAVDIARLRFWLSLIVDEKEPKPLPNLDYKIMQGNSLVESFEDIQLDAITKDGVTVYGPPKQMTFGEEFDKPQKEIEFTIEEKTELKKWVQDYFSIDNLADKQNLHHKIDKAVLNHLDKNTQLYEISALRQVAEIEDKYTAAGKNIADYPTGKDYKTWHTLKTKSENTRAKLEKINQSAERPYFLWHLYFQDVFTPSTSGRLGVGLGFDIIIGNPPYGGTKIDDATQTEYKLASKDPYGAFISMAINKLLKPDGILCYIVSDTWLTIKSHKPLREQVLQYDLKNVIRLHKDCFNATVNSCIFTLKKTPQTVIAKSCEEQSKANTSASSVANSPFGGWGAGLIAADLTNISTRKQIPEFREKLFHLDDYIGQYSPDFAVYAYPQSLLQTNSNHPIIVGSPKLFALMNDTTVAKIDKEINGQTIAVRQVEFNGKTIELVRFGDVADVKQGLVTGNNKNYLYQNKSAYGNYDDITELKKFILNEDDLNKIKNNEEIRLKVIDKGIHKDNEESNFDFNRYFDGRFIVELDKGGASDTDDGWLPNYFVPTDYFIDWSTFKINSMNTNTSEKQSGKIASRFQNKDSYFKNGLTFSFAGIYCPTYRLSETPIYLNASSRIFLNYDQSDEYILAIMNSKFIRLISRIFCNHTINFGIDDVKDIILTNTFNSKIELLANSIIKNQKQNPRYNYFENEQKEIDLLVYELYGLNADDINEVETWFARRYPKLSKYAYWQPQANLQTMATTDNSSMSKLQSLTQLIAQGETKTVEFKSSLRYDIREQKVNKNLEHSCFKNIAAFLNSDGGTLFIGVDDDGNILGLENTDFASFKGSNKKDEFTKHFDNLVGNYFGNNLVHKINLDFENIDNKTIAIITIKTKASEPIIIKNPEKNNQEEFYIRRNASAIGLTMYEMLNYIKENWG
jgi:Putative DNA-binding domain/Eco57I restriction-modification methylase